MNSDRALELVNQLLWNSMVIAGPVLMTALVVGMAVSIIQVATQLQESTLAYVPKLVACALVLTLLGPWLIGRLTAYATSLIMIIPQLS
jgi:flagellar biosynthetic protein FliQ